MIYKNLNEVSLMIWNASAKEQEIKLNVKKGVRLNVGDSIECGSLENRFYYNITEILEDRQSSISSYNYITAKAVRDVRGNF